MKFTQIGAWSNYPRLTIDEFIQRFPNVETQENESKNDDEYDLDDEEFRERFEDDLIILIEGNVSITAEQLHELAKEYTLMVVVDGNLSIEGYSSKILYVSGDMYSNSIDLHNGLLKHPVGGRVVARDCTWLFAEDDCFTREGPVVRLETPFLFSWFYNIDNIDVSPETVIFILADWDYCTSLSLPNPIFTWHDVVFVLDEQFVDGVDSASTDRRAWNHYLIKTALEKGENILRKGFDIACIKYQKEANEAMVLKNYRRAYLLSKKSAMISPSYYKAWLAMANALSAVGAYEQALEPYQQAIKCFPSKQTGLVNTAANYGSLSAIRCRNLPLAITLATVSIEHTKEGIYDKHRLAIGYRFRAEAYLLSGRDEDALKDLNSALSYHKDHGTVNWLMGLLHFRRNDLKQATKYHQIAMKSDIDFAVYYDNANSTDFLSCKPARVDWDTQSIESIVIPIKDEA